MGPDLQHKDPCPAGVFHMGALFVVMQILPLVRKGSGLARRTRP